MENKIKHPKRFVPINTYCETSGLSYHTVNHMLNSGQLPYITTESGLRRVDTQEMGVLQNAVIVERLEAQERLLGEQERLLKCLCDHLGVSGERR